MEPPRCGLSGRTRRLATRQNRYDETEAVLEFLEFVFLERTFCAFFRSLPCFSLGGK